MDTNGKDNNAFFGFVFIGFHLSRHSLGEGGFVVKMNIFVS